MFLLSLYTVIYHLLPHLATSLPQPSHLMLRGGEFRSFGNELATHRRLVAGAVTVLVGPPSGNTTRGDIDGVHNRALFYDPYGSTLSSDNTYLLVADSGNNKIRKVVLSTRTVTTFVGPSQGTTTSGTANGAGTTARFTQPVGIRLSNDNTFALIAEYGHRIRKVVVSTLAVTTVAGGTSAGTTDGTGTVSRFNYPSDICISSDGSYALITDTGSHRIRKLTLATSAVVGFVGSNAGTSGSSDGVGTNARLNSPFGIELIPGGTYALVADTINKLIRKVVITTLAVTTIAGSTSSSGTGDGIGTNAKLYAPYGISISSDSSYAMFVGGSYRLRKLTLSTNAVTTFAGQDTPGDVEGTGTNAMFNFPTSVCITSDLNWFLVVDQLSNKVKLVAALASSTFSPTLSPSVTPTFQPSSSPTSSPTFAPSVIPTFFPTFSPSLTPTLSPTSIPTHLPTISTAPTTEPSISPSISPTLSPTITLSTSSPTTQSDSNTSNSNEANDDELSDGAIAGIVVGSVVGVGMLVAGGFYLLPQVSSLYAPTPKVTPEG